MGKIKSLEMVEVVKIEILVGSGTKQDPERYVTQYWDKSGQLLVTLDEAARQTTLHPDRPVQRQYA